MAKIDWERPTRPAEDPYRPKKRRPPSPGHWWCLVDGVWVVALVTKPRGAWVRVSTFNRDRPMYWKAFDDLVEKWVRLEPPR